VTLLDAVGAVVAGLLVLYLLASLIFPERF
jgi:K+-transporting ATPase KdpF subunit